MLTKEGEIRINDFCLDYEGGASHLGVPQQILVIKCHGLGGNQNWSYKNKKIMHLSGFCIELAKNNNRSVVMNTCNSTSSRQLWEWSETASKKQKNMVM